jgi:hypothetical protein
MLFQELTKRGSLSTTAVLFLIGATSIQSPEVT